MAQDEVVLDGELSLLNQLDGEAGTVIEVGHDTGIDTIVFNADYTLTFNMTNGETFTTRSIRGEQGETGEKGEHGDDYVLTQADKAEIAGLVDAPIEDVQINGESVVTDGVAEIPYGTNNVYGIVKGAESKGINIVNGILEIIQATSSHIKNGALGYCPIAPQHQHESVFYGLAKAAGDTTQSQSSNPVGQYTNSAKSTIKKMIGINDEFELIRCITLEEDSQNVIIDTDESSSPFSLQGFMIAIVSVAATGATAEGYLKIALNSTLHNVNRIFDIHAGIRKGSSYKNILVIGTALNGIGHSVIQTSQDLGGYIVDENGILNRSIYGTTNSVAFSNQQVINSVFVGTDNASLKLGVGSIIALYGIRV